MLGLKLIHVSKRGHWPANKYGCEDYTVKAKCNANKFYKVAIKQHVLWNMLHGYLCLASRITFLPEKEVFGRIFSSGEEVFGRISPRGKKVDDRDSPKSFLPMMIRSYRKLLLYPSIVQLHRSNPYLLQSRLVESSLKRESPISLHWHGYTYTKGQCLY